MAAIDAARSRSGQFAASALDDPGLPAERRSVPIRQLTRKQTGANRRNPLARVWIAMMVANAEWEFPVKATVESS